MDNPFLALFKILEQKDIRDRVKNHRGHETKSEGLTPNDKNSLLQYQIL